LPRFDSFFVTLALRFNAQICAVSGSFRPILLKNSIAPPGRTSHRKVDRSECATSDASGPGRGSTTPRNHSKASAEEFFNRIGQNQTLARNHISRFRGLATGLHSVTGW
jgi:hypothetical protein